MTTDTKLTTATFLETLAESKIKYVAVDTESNGKDHRDGSGHTWGLSVAFRLVEALPPFTMYFSVRHPDFKHRDDEIQMLFSILHTKTLVFHNAKFDLPALNDLGFDFKGQFFDTMLMVHILDEEMPSKALDYCAKYYIKDSKEKSPRFLAWLKVFGWEEMRYDIVEEYAAHDAFVTLLLFEFLLPRWQKEELDRGDYWREEQRFIRALIEIESTGVLINQDFVRSEIARGHKIMAEIEEALGVKPTGNALKDLLLDQLGLPVVKETPSGKPSFDKEAMAHYDEMLTELDSPVAKQILTYRGWQVAIGLSYENFLKYVSDADGRARPNFKIHGTVTGRLSCEKPNLQQIPRTSDKDWNGGLKAAFVPTPGWELWDFDYKNLELRLGAAYAEELELIKIFRSDQDVFTEMSKELGLTRQDTKTLVYTMQFGGGANRIATVFKVPHWQANSIRDNFFMKYPNMLSTMKKAEKAANANSKVRVWSGRYRHFNGAGTYKAFNSAIQGGAADIVKRQITRIHNSLDSDVARIVLTVHDSLVVEIREDQVTTLRPMIKEMMETVIPDFGVPFDVDVKKWGS